MSIEILDLSDEYADYLHDESRREGCADRIVFPTSTEDVAEAMQMAGENGWPVTVQGGRTGITGGSVPDGGLILNLSRMKRIGAVSNARMSVEAGAVLSDIRKVLEGSGLFFPPDLTETSATIGGMVANNASGARSFRYGSVRPWIHGLKAVLSSGEVVELERGVHKADGMFFRIGSLEGELPELPIPGVKAAAGYFVKPEMDLVDLFIGAEGTLGVVTEISIRLLPEPEQMIGLCAFFAAEKEGLEFVRFLRDSSNPVAIEFFDFHALDLLRRMKAEVAAFADLPELQPDFHTAVYFEYENKVPESVQERAEDAVECWMADDECDIEALKQFRHAVPEAVNLLIGVRKRTIPRLTKLGTDMSVPDARLEDVMHMYHEELNEAGLEYVIFGHIGSNHLHVNILPHCMEEYEKGRAIYLDWAKQVVAMGGCVSAEHGIGKLKRDFLRLMFGDKGIRQMQQLKQLFDPSGLLNRGNLFSGSC
ncbi:MAG TPA: FAD-binding oxidoreductase [Pontiella sp.]|nr:FAD-binding oxidoreductase [Pontiella sp.]